jgi:hypothetical protein
MDNKECFFSVLVLHLGDLCKIILLFVFFVPFSNLCWCSDFLWGIFFVVSDLFFFFCLLAYSAPAISSRSHKSSLQSPSSDSTSKSPWKSYSNGDRSTTPEFDDNASLVGAAPLLKSFVTQVSTDYKFIDY